MKKLNKLYTGNRKMVPIFGIIIFIGVILLLIYFVRNYAFNTNSSKGFMAVNSDRAEYLSGETVTIEMGVLGSNGNTLCNANLELNINGTKTTNIKKSSTCGDTVANSPDYFFQFVPQHTGVYKIELKNLDTKNAVKNKFRVNENRNLDIVRETATRINPGLAERYPVRLIVKASKDFQGEVYDTIPVGFTIPWQGPAKVSDDGKKGKVISWQLNLKAGEIKELIYEYSTPKMVPAVYKLGNSGEWQIVAAK
jgi:hypothetical protein